MEKIVLRLKELRGDEPQAKFAAKLELPQQTYSRYESGRSEPPLALLKDIALRFGVSTDWLLGLTDKDGPSVSATNSTVAAFGSTVTGGDCSRCPLMLAAREAIAPPGGAVRDGRKTTRKTT
jgi:transcriptional regulator with XRE-family HTH domain